MAVLGSGWSNSSSCDRSLRFIAFEAKRSTREGLVLGFCTFWLARWVGLDKG
jgi:hypothetical protein